MMHGTTNIKKKKRILWTLLRN